MIRRYKLSDVEQIVDHVEKNLSQSRYKNISFSRNKIIDRLVGNVNNSLFFCNVATDDNENIIGGLGAVISQYSWSHEAFAFDYLFYVNESDRSLAVATELVVSYIEWAKQRKVREVLFQNIAGYKPELFAKFASKMGFKQIGSISSMEF